MQAPNARGKRVFSEMNVLDENRVISIEPALYFDDIGGFRHSGTVLVIKDGYEILTHYSTNLDDRIVRDNRTARKLKGAVVRKAVSIGRTVTDTVKTTVQPITYARIVSHFMTDVSFRLMVIDRWFIYG